MTDNIGGANDVGETKSSEIDRRMEARWALKRRHLVHIELFATMRVDSGDDRTRIFNC